MKSLVLLSIFILSTACGPSLLPVVESSPTSLVASQTAPVVLPTGTSTRLPPSPTAAFGRIVDNLAIDRQGQLYASGFGALGDTVRRFAAWDGATWIALGNGFQTAGNVLAVDSAGQLYTEALTDSGQGMETAMMSWDGTTWGDITGNFSLVVDALQAGRISSNIPVTALAVDGEDHLFAAGSFQYLSEDGSTEWPMGYVAKWDQDAWTVLGQGFNQVYIYGMAVSETGKVYVAGVQPRTPPAEFSSAGFIAEWDGEIWTEIDTNRLGPCLSIRSLALDKAGGLYASCIPIESGELIFYRDGRDWIGIVDRLEGEAPTIYDMGVDDDSNLCIGGSFDAVSGVPARNIACRAGSVWHPLGEGIDGQVFALTFDPGGGLYAAGFLRESGGSPAAYVARWDGRSWLALAP